MWKETFKALILMLISFLLFSLIINLLYYFDVINNDITKYFKMIFTIISFMISGIYLGLHSPNKGYLYGIRLSGIIVIILIISSIIWHNFKFQNIIYYLITIFSITFGSILGINKKNN